jgi:hypothetical protein
VADLDAVGPGEGSVTVVWDCVVWWGSGSPDVVVVVAVVPRVGVRAHGGRVVDGR